MARNPKIDAVMAALADPTRRRIVELLAGGRAMTISELSRHFAVSRQAVTKHLEVLGDVRLVKCERKGRERLNRLHARALRPLAAWIHSYAEFWEDRLAALKDTVERGIEE